MTALVIVGVDGSEESLAAVAWAAQEAALRDVALDLLHVETGPETPEGRSSPQPNRSAALLHDAAELARRHQPSVEVSTRSVRGRPPEVLTHAADEAELTVLGSRGLGGISGYLIGSVSLAVVGRARHPVVLVRTPADGTGDAPAAGGIVAGVDLAHISDRLLGFAFTEAARRGGALHIVHCWSLPPVYVYGGVMDPHIGDELGEHAAHRLTELLQPWQKTYSGVSVTHEVVTGSPGLRLVSAAQGAALLVVGRRSRKVPLGPHIGHVAHAVIHHSPAPVALVPLD
ncbi:universal stress protein UspA [Streptomyces venezuelae]|uniref:Universal stress protein UspA n=1 Tax=Streptomyces venezuelae TaxID=54571 RepID=A0A5P2CXT2_STRVZ|nr:universal stress protein [Streptomyces venezuelae]QES47070.1 universal stress protein UspA [Streptomyces venezuelae]